MILRDVLSTAVKGVTVNTGRSFLTMLGIIIGVGSVVLMSSVGASMQQVILSQISILGPQSMVVFPGQQEGGPSSVATGFDSVTLEDVAQIERLATVRLVAPVIFVPGIVTYGRQQGNPQIFGVTPTYFANFSMKTTEGRLLDENDDRSMATAVLGPDVRDKLFGSSSPLGKRVTIADRSYVVVGVMEPLGSQFFQNADDRIYIPLSTAKEVTGQKYINYMPMLAVTDFETAFADVKNLLRRRHRIDNPADDPKKDDFVVRNSAQANEILGTVSLGLTLFITTIAAISLLVGGIGIMNIMLVSVTERTREIGLRKAVGAKRGDILLQFLLEAVALTVIGGAIGLVGGIALAFLIAAVVAKFLSAYSFVVSVTAMVVALLMAGITGLVFGISPARKAALLSPMEALRYE